jgi:hypothetical protein
VATNPTNSTTLNAVTTDITQLLPSQIPGLPTDTATSVPKDRGLDHQEMAPMRGG